MTARAPETEGGLTVASDVTGWGVWHDASGLPAVTKLRLKRFALQARADLLSTGVDFTASKREIQKARRQWSEVYYRWAARSRATGLDPETQEFYPKHSQYGQLIPSAAKAAQLRGETS